MEKNHKLQCGWQAPVIYASNISVASVAVNVVDFADTARHLLRAISHCDPFFWKGRQWNREAANCGGGDEGRGRMMRDEVNVNQQDRKGREGM